MMLVMLVMVLMLFFGGEGSGSDAFFVVGSIRCKTVPEHQVAEVQVKGCGRWYNVIYICGGQ